MRSRHLPVRSTTTALLAAAALLAQACGSGETATGRRPSLVLIVIDTLRADAVLSPPPGVEVPNLDRLARDGIVFDRAFAHAPMTLPSHAALFSSRYPHESKVLNNHQRVPEELPLLAEHLAERGYDTRAVIALGTLTPHGTDGSSLERGFGTYLKARGPVSDAADVAGALADVVDDLDAERPFFLFAHFADPHEPYNDRSSDPRTARILLDGEEIDTATTSVMTWWTPQLELEPGEHVIEIVSEHAFLVRSFAAYLRGVRLDSQFEEGELREPLRRAAIRFRNPSKRPQTIAVDLWLAERPPLRDIPRRYFDELEHADRYVGAVISMLEERGLYDSSLIVFTSDHGEELGERGRAGHVQTLYDEMLHVPLVVKPPVDFERTHDLRARSRDLVRLVDLTPTILDALGLPALRGQRGTSLLSGEAPGVLVAETHKPEANHDIVAMRSDRWKLVYVADDDRFELYDLAADPGETTDLFEEHGGEHVAWQEELRRIAAVALEGDVVLDQVDDETRERLEALGY